MSAHAVSPLQTAEANTRHEKIVPTQDRARKTRATLLDAVEQIVSESGIDAVTTTSIAQQTHVAVGTIYRYFQDRDALLLAAYDGTVARIVESCAAGLTNIPQDLPVEDAALEMLRLYLATAEAIPSHPGLLKAMRAIRPVEADQSGPNEAAIIGSLLQPFLERYGNGAEPDPARLHFFTALLSLLIDLYLMTAPGPERHRLQREIEEHMLLALARLLRDAPGLR